MEFFTFRVFLWVGHGVSLGISGGGLGIVPAAVETRAIGKALYSGMILYRTCIS